MFVLRQAQSLFFRRNLSPGLESTGLFFYEVDVYSFLVEILVEICSFWSRFVYSLIYFHIFEYFRHLFSYFRIFIFIFSNVFDIFIFRHFSEAYFLQYSQRRFPHFRYFWVVVRDAGNTTQLAALAWGVSSD